MTSLAIYGLAAVAEIAGCFAFWAWLRLGKSGYWILPGITSLTIFAILLTRIDLIFAGRTFAAYGGVYIAVSLLWLCIVEDQRLNKWDIVGAVICIAGAAIILFGPRQQI